MLCTEAPGIAGLGGLTAWGPLQGMQREKQQKRQAELLNPPLRTATVQVDGWGAGGKQQQLNIDKQQHTRNRRRENSSENLVAGQAQAPAFSYAAADTSLTREGLVA